MTEAPRDGLVRSAIFQLERSEETTDGLTLEGYAAVFDTPTRIDSWEGRFDEQIARGAFTKSLRERTPVLQFDHGTHVRIGSIPIGTIESLVEDSHGLAVRARVFDDPETGLLRQAIRAGAIDGMSFRFSVVKDNWEERDDAPMRTLKEVKVHELGPVVFPAYAETSVSLRAKQWAQDLDEDPGFARDVADALILRGLDLPQTTDAERAAGEHSTDDGSTTDEPLEEHSTTPTLRDRIRAERIALQAVIDTKGARRG